MNADLHNWIPRLVRALVDVRSKVYIVLFSFTKIIQPPPPPKKKKKKKKKPAKALLNFGMYPIYILMHFTCFMNY